MAEKKSTGKAMSTPRKHMVKKVDRPNLLCNAKLSNGEPCPKTVEDGKTFCQWHDPEDVSWHEVYARLMNATPEGKRDIVLRLIEDHPEHQLVLPERGGLKADLTYIDLSLETLEKRRVQSGLDNPPWWDSKEASPNLKKANLTGAHLESAHLQGAQLWLAQLQDAHLRNAKLQGAQLRRANLYKANLQDADLSGASLVRADLQEAHLEDAIFLEADLKEAQLQHVNLSIVKNLSNIYLSEAWLEGTRIKREQLDDTNREEREQDYAGAKRAYLTLKQNFDSLGDYDAGSWAYRKERRMEKLEAREMGRAALKLRQWKDAIAGYSKFLSDTFVEWLCDYGESVWRVICWMAFLLFVLGPFLFSRLGGFVWSHDLAKEFYALPSAWDQFWFSYRLSLLYTLDTFTTASFSGLQPINDTVKFASGFFAIAGIVLAGLLGFVAGNRIRRS